MPGPVNNAFSARRDHADCSGCSLCLLVCPVWRKTRDISFTPHGRAKAIQHGDAVDRASVESCTLCLACDPVCPEQIDQLKAILGLRKLQGLSGSALPAKQMPLRHAPANFASTLLLPDAALHASADTLARVIALLANGDKFAVSEDDGSDISLALEAAVEIEGQRLENFLSPLRRMKKIIVADGLLFRQLKLWMPKICIISLGEALSGHASVRRSLCATDLYVIEPRAYHAEYQRMVIHYDRLRAECGSAFNLDLQRIAIPATARSLPQRLGLSAFDDDEQASWVLKGRKISRIVVESLEDRAVLEKVSEVPVVHLAEVAVAQPEVY
jgi:ferredoxin